MEINIWGCLWNLDDGPFLMRQRIPEVCVFKRCRLDGWYHSSANGLVLRRREHLTVQDLLEVFFAAAADAQGNVGEQAPVAILRKQSSAFEDGCTSLEVPHASVLSAKELTVLMERVQSGIAEADIWSIQTVVWPEDGLRVVSVYSCEVTGSETSEVFARQFHRAYPTGTKGPALPCPGDVANDICMPVPGPRRASVEGKTLNAVRFASRFHSLDFEGLVLEYVFTADGHVVLHGCWCSTLFPQEARRRLRQRSASGRTGSVPRAYPVPTVEAEAEAEGGLRELRAEASRPWLDCSSVAPTPSAAATPDVSLLSKMEGTSVEDSCMVLELWRGDEFLGEALLPCQRQCADVAEHVLRLRVGDTPWPSRADTRKRQATGWAGVPVDASIVLSVEWILSSTAAAPLMRLFLVRSQGLPSPLPGTCNPRFGTCPGVRATLWQRQWGCSEFAALWTSREAQEAPRLTSTSAGQRADAAVAVEWGEAVDLSLSPVAQEQPARKAACRPTRSSSRVDMKSPPKCLSRSGEPVQPQRVVVELQSTIKSPTEVVCGAELSAHWGMSEEDGSMRTHIMAAQVSQRLSTESRGRLRSGLLTKMAGQLEQFHDVQLEWEQSLAVAQATMQRADHDIDCQEREVAAARQETAAVVDNHEKRLVAICQEMCGSVDDEKTEEHRDKTALEQSQQRIQQQQLLASQFAEKSQGLQASLEKTVRRFDEVSTSYAALQKELQRRQAGRRPPPASEPELAATRERADGLVAEVVQEERDLSGLKLRLHRLREQLAAEKAHSFKLEDFVRRIATAPATSMRTGGGYDLDYTASREAATLIQEMAQG